MDKTLGENIKKLRKELNLTNEEFGKRIGESKTTISHWQNSKRRPSADKIKLMCEVFNLPANYFLETESKKVDLRYMLNNKFDYDSIEKIEKKLNEFGYSLEESDPQKIKELENKLDKALKLLELMQSIKE